MPNTVFSTTVTMPTRPMVAMKAKARGTPAKLEATPEKVSRPERSALGRPPRVTEKASSSPNRPPATAVTALTSMVTR